MLCALRAGPLGLHEEYSEPRTDDFGELYGEASNDDFHVASRRSPPLQHEKDVREEGAGFSSSFCPPMTHCVGGRGHGEDEKALTLTR